MTIKPVLLNVNDYKEIITCGFAYKLPEETIELVKELCVDMNVAFNQTKQRDFSIPLSNSKGGIGFSNTNSQGKRNKQRNGGEITTEDWEMIRNFKATKIEKTEGIEKTINDIRVCLNKISVKNAENQYNNLINYIREIFDKHDLQSDVGKRVTSLVLEICYTNKFYADIYADIYIRLIKEYPIFQEIVNKSFIEVFEPSFERIVFIDPNDGERYMEFCKNNKENENRKSMLLFYIKLMKNRYFNKKHLVDCATKLFDYIYKYIDEVNRSYEVEEITENIYLLITNANTELSIEAEWDEMCDKIQELSQMKHTSKPSITNRAIFKFMDLIEFN